MSLTPEQENLKKVWLAKKELHFLCVGSYNEWAAEEALLDALQCCLDAGFDPRNPCSETPLPDFPLPGPTLTLPDPEPMQKYNRTIRCVYITPADDTVSPIFSDKAVIVTVEDEAGGPFLLINTVNSYGCKGEVRIDFEELEEVVAVARELINQPTLKESSND
jgi:hypothetical protein